MNKMIAEYDCFISAEYSNNILILDHNRLKSLDYKIIDANYKHTIPLLQMSIDVNEELKPKKSLSSDDTELELCTDSNAFDKKTFRSVVHFSDGEAHFVPITRPVLSTFISQRKPVENKSIDNKRSNKDKSKSEYNPISEQKKSFEKFYEYSKERKFRVISDVEKARQPWIKTRIESSDIDLSESRDTKFICYRREDLRIPKQSVAKEHVPVNEEKHVVKVSCTKPLVPLGSEVLDVLLEYKFLKFSKLMGLLKDRQKVDIAHLSEKNVLSHLPKVALLIRGHWVIKSEVLFKMNPGDGAIPIEKLCLARDFILCVFYTGDTITTKTVQSKTSLPSARVTEILEQLSERVMDSKGAHWRFPEHDYEFINAHNDINQSQINILDVKSKEVFCKLKIDITGEASRKRSFSGTGSSLGRSDSLSQKRNRSQSFQIDFDPSGVENVTPMKRKRLNEDPQEESEISIPVQKEVSPKHPEGDRHPSQIVESSQEQQSQQIEDFPMFCMKSEPNISPCYSPEFEGGMSDHEIEEFKLEASADQSQTCVKLDSSATATEVNEDGLFGYYASEAMKVDLMSFVRSELNKFNIIGLRSMAEKYMEKCWPKLKPCDIGNWSNLSNSQKIDRLLICIEEILSDESVREMNVNWSGIDSALESQKIYLLHNESVKDKSIIETVAHLISKKGFFVISDVKKELPNHTSNKSILSQTDSMLRDKLKKFCEFVRRKYYLKFTVDSGKSK